MVLSLADISDIDFLFLKRKKPWALSKIGRKGQIWDNQSYDCLRKDELQITIAVRIVPMQKKMWFKYFPTSALTAAPVM